MHKLIIQIPATEKLPEFDVLWPEFLHLVEQMPGLQREATSHIQHVVYGRLDCSMIHELFFQDYEALAAGLDSVAGRRAAGILHRLTRQQAILMIADHKEDNLENIQRYRPAAPDEPAK